MRKSRTVVYTSGLITGENQTYTQLPVGVVNRKRGGVRQVRDPEDDYTTAGNPFMNKSFFETHRFIEKTKQGQFINPKLYNQGRSIDHSFIDRTFKENCEGKRFYTMGEHLLYGSYSS